MRVDQRRGGREDRGHAVMVGDQDIDAARGGDRDLGPGARAGIDRHDHGDPGGRRRLDRRERQAVPLIQAARDVGLDLQPEPAQGEDQDRQAVEAVRVEVAEDHHPFRALARRGQSVQQSVRVRQESRVVESGQRLREPGLEIRDAGHPATGEQARHPLGKPATERRLREIRGDGS